MEYKIPESSVNGLLKYLCSRPYGEVFNMIDHLKALPAIEPDEAPKPKAKK